MKRRTFLGRVAASTTAAALFERSLEAAQSQPQKAHQGHVAGHGDAGAVTATIATIEGY